MYKLLARHEVEYLKRTDIRLIDPLGGKPNYLVIDQEDTGEYLINTVRDRDMTGEFLIGVHNVKIDSQEQLYGHLWMV